MVALSVIVFMFVSRDSLERCLTALHEQLSGADAEIIVPYDDTLVDARAMMDRFARARFLHVPGRRTPAELRAHGTAASRGRIVAFLEDHCVPAPDWHQHVLRAHQEPHAAVGGPVEKGLPPNASGDTALNWALYLSDYSRYMLPMPAGPSHSLTDCNVSYKREALQEIRESWAKEFHENVVHGALAARGATLWFDPGMVVFEQRHMSWRGALTDRYTFGRLFGSTRVTGAPAVRRAAVGAAALLMPPLLVARVARTLASRGRHRGQLFRCLPHLTVLAGAWMLGEAMGYWTGSSGRTLRPSST
jgi:hypothetical protein